ncbi:MAG: TolC family protein [Bacteroidota bacterium]
MSIIKRTLFIILLFALSQLSAQDTWSLDRCIDYALQQSPTVLRSELDVDLAKLDYKEAKNGRLPTLEGQGFMLMQFGRTIDPTTNSFNNQRITSNDLSIRGNLNLFNGGRTINRIRQQEQVLAGSEQLNKATELTTSINVLRAYVSVLLAEDQLAQAKLNQASLTDQFKNMERQSQVGTASVTQRLELEAQVAQADQQVVQNEYLLQTAQNDLKRQLFLPLETPLDIARIKIEEINMPVLNETELVNSIRQSFPTLTAQNAFLKAAEYDIKASKGALLPSIGLFANVNSFFSSAAQRVDGFRATTTERDAIIMGNPGTVIFTGEDAILSNNPYFNQLNENLGQRVGLFINVPIFNQGLNRLNIERSKVNLYQSRLDYTEAKQQLDLDLQQAILDVRAAWDIHKSAQENLAVNERLLQSKRKEYEYGATNQLDYLIIQNQYQDAVVQSLRAQYDYWFKMEVLKMYQQVR